MNFNSVEIIDHVGEVDGLEIKINGVILKNASAYNVERRAGSPIGRVTFTILCDDVKVEHINKASCK